MKRGESAKEERSVRLNREIGEVKVAKKQDKREAPNREKLKTDSRLLLASERGSRV